MSEPQRAYDTLRARIAALEAERDAAIQRDNVNAALTRAAIKKSDARIAELDAANAICRRDIEALMSSADKLEDEIDRLMAALAEIGGMADIGLNIGPAIRTAKAALSGEGVT